MGLDFTNIRDNSGAALYILHGRSALQQEKFERLRDEILEIDQNGHQVILLDVTSLDGEKVRDFYDILPERLPVALLVRDDDSIAQQWQGDYIPSAADIAFHLRQIST